MSFTAEWTPASGFNTSGYTVTFGKPLNQCSVTELLAHPMCGSNNPIANCAYVAEYSSLGYGSVAMHLLNAQFKEPIPNGQSNTWVCEPSPTGDLAKIYRRTIFVGMPTNVTAPQYCLTDESDSRILIIENIKDPNKLVYNYGNMNFNVGATAQYRTCANQLRHTCNKGQSTYGSAPNTVTYEDPDTHTTTVYKICAYQVYIIDNDCFICGWDYIGYFLGRYQNATNEYNGLTWGSSFTSFKHENGNCLYIGCNINGTGSETNLQGILGDDIYADPVPDPATFVNTNVDYAPTNIELQNVKLRFHMSNSTIGGSLRSCTLTIDLYDTEEVRKHQMARAGTYFAVNGELFKPIISGGIVTGYGTPDKVSEIDTYTDLNHPVPSGGGTPPSGPWDVDPETYGWSGGEVSGMVKYYLLTSGQMGSLQAAIASNANWTIDYLNCIVSCFVVPNSGIFFDAPIPTTVKFKLDNATEWDTGVGCSRIQGTINKKGGTIEIPRLTNTFYDFEPYSDYSVYIPFCGRVPIKGNVCLGREIKVTYYPDVPTCSLTAVVSCGGATIAIAKGSFGTMTPVTSNGSDRKTAAVIGDVAPIITGIGTGIVGVALGNPLIVGAGAAQALGGIMGGVKETVQSYAYSVGSTGDSSFFGAGNRCFYYANYPLIDDVVNDSMFGHSVGYLCNTVGKLSTFAGFTMCANPHVTFSASAEEREEIERLLSIGVIL